MREDAARDLGDFFGFTISPGKPFGDVAKGRNYTVHTRIGTRRFDSFSVDMITSVRMTSPAHVIPPEAPIHFATPRG